MLTCPIVFYLTWVTGTEIADDDSRWMEKNSGPCMVMSTDGGFYTVSCTALEYFACEQGIADKAKHDIRFKFAPSTCL